MSSKLKQVQNHMIKYTETIASVLNIDIEIIDDRLLRVSGTGIYKNNINEMSMTEGYIYRQVLESGEKIVVLDVCSSEICKVCIKHAKCLEKSIIAFPIKYNDKTIGVIGAITSDSEKKIEINKKIESYLEFMNNMSDLISMKVREHESNEATDKKISMLKEIIDNVDKSVVILDTWGKISYINNIATKKLGISENPIGELLKITPLEDSRKEHELSLVNVENNVYTAKMKIIPVYPSVNKYHKIIIFDEINESNIDGKINSKWEIKTIDSIVGESEIMSDIKYRTKKFANSNSTVLITGESGTGKELIAKSIHAEGNRCNKPFIAINCAAIPETLLESELFGYVKGAFSGANNSGKIGKFELANEGIIFLDEIGDLSMHLQAKLLRVLQERKLARIGSNKLIDLDIRIIAATNQNILDLVREGKFRDDLYYRLNVIQINLPPLRERKEDLKEILMKFITKYSLEFDITLNKIEDSVMDMLLNYNWPGNIRELENAAEYMMNLVGEEGVITVDMIPFDIINYYNKEHKYIKTKEIKENDFKFIEDVNDELIKSKEDIISIKDIELLYINKILDIYGRDTQTKKDIAKKLGIGVSTLYRKLEGN